MNETAEGAGLRLLEDQHARAKMQQQELRAAVAAGLASGPGKSAGTAFGRLETKYRKLTGKRAE